MIYLRLLGYFFLAALCVQSPPVQAQGISPALTSHTAAPPTQSLSVLFLGNSYIFVNDLPAMLVQIASSDLSNRTQLNVRSVTRSGARLSDLWDSGEALRVLQSQHWDYVILQEQSLWAVNPSQIADTFEAATKWNKEITQQHGRTILFDSWAREPESPWYSDPQYSGLDMENASHMQQIFDQRTKELGVKLGASVANIGDYWAMTEKQVPGLNLFASDGSHPSAAGTYLTALVFYRALTGSPLNNIHYAPEGVSSAAAGQLIAISLR